MKSSDSNKIAIYLGLIIAMFFWSIAFIWSKQALDIFSPFTLVFFRLIVSAVFITTISLFLKKLQRIKKEHIKYFLLLSFFEPFLYFIGEAMGLQYVSSTMASVIISTIPLFMPFALLLFYREKLSFYNILGIVISIAGVFLVIVNKDFNFNVPVKGIMLLMLAVISAVGYTMLIVKLGPHYNAFSIVAYQNILGSVGFLVLFLVFDYDEFTQIPFNFSDYIPIIELGIFPSTISFILLTVAIRSIGANRASVFTNTIPVITAILAFYMLNESLEFIKIIGILVVIGGLFISQIKFSKK